MFFHALSLCTLGFQLACSSFHVRGSRITLSSVALTSSPSPDSRETRTACCCRDAGGDAEFCKYRVPQFLAPCGWFSGFSEVPYHRCWDNMMRTWERRGSSEHLEPVEQRMRSDVETAARRLKSCDGGAIVIEGEVEALTAMRSSAVAWAQYLKQQGLCVVYMADRSASQSVGNAPDDALPSTQASISLLAQKLRELVAPRSEVSASTKMRLLSRLVVVFSDHGLPGRLVLGGDNTLNRDDWLRIVGDLHGSANRLLMYVLACYSGSMFSKSLLLEPAQLQKALQVETPLYLASEYVDDSEDINKVIAVFVRSFDADAEGLHSFLRNFIYSVALCGFQTKDSEAKRNFKHELMKLACGLGVRGEDCRAQSQVEEQLAHLWSTDRFHDAAKAFVTHERRLVKSINFSAALVTCSDDETKEPFSKCMSSLDGALAYISSLSKEALQCVGGSSEPSPRTGRIFDATGPTLGRKGLLRLIYAFLNFELNLRRADQLTRNTFALDDQLALICNDRPQSCFAVVSSIPSFPSVLGYDIESEDGDREFLADSFFFASILADLRKFAAGSLQPSEQSLREHFRRLQSAHPIAKHQVDDTNVSVETAVRYRDVATGIAMSRDAHTFELFQPVAFGNAADLSLADFFSSDLLGRRRAATLD
eukprot:TRINITY_DN1423_c1_g3_i1.p1 TRINITY_DN1423_c1_g3~~TRINITY_DN1423_c1_g3_i1.p1  ORF type:complete len:651 (+),score=70.24 TRINITY_DN1423_c1_g3_i1:47-1999(+)